MYTLPVLSAARPVTVVKSATVELAPVVAMYVEVPRAPVAGFRLVTKPDVLPAPVGNAPPKLPLAGTPGKLPALVVPPTNIVLVFAYAALVAVDVPVLPRK